MRAVAVSRTLGEVLRRVRVHLGLHEPRQPRAQHDARLVRLRARARARVRARARLKVRARVSTWFVRCSGML